MSDSTVKQVKVDNWGIFFLQRLQQLFSKSEYCDLVLVFNTNERIKVHRLVLNACTEYFQMLERQGFVKGDCLRMPQDLQPDVVVPIINFMYTGRLEFRTELLKRLYTTAQQMNMTVLTKLLDAQNSATAPQHKPLVRRPAQVPITYNLQGKKIAPKQIDPDLPETLPGRKLPIWKRRNVPNVPETSSIGYYESPSRISSSVVVDESPRPTRFDWPEEAIDTSSYSSSFDDLSYETKPLVKPILCAVSKPPVPKVDTTSRISATFEEVCRTATNMKRIHSSPASVDEAAAKRAKMLDLQAVKEYVQEHRLRKHLLDNTEENGDEVEDDLAVADLDDDDDLEDEDGELSFEGMPEQSVLPQGQEEQTSFHQIQESLPLRIPSVTSEPSTTPTQPIRQSVLPPQKSILKPQASHEETVPSTPVSVASKKVRFLLDAKSPEGKENAAATASATKIRRADEGQRPLPTRADNLTSIGAAVSNAGNLTNHAKIITEVLKKYPHLVKNNKNIRLKIMQRGGAQITPMVAMDGDASKMVKSKVSYVVLKSDVAGKGKPAVVLKHGGHVEPLSELGGQQKPASGAENTTGPWLCHSCGSNEEPVHFDSYYLYRRHLQDVHMEKIDARICEHCGHRASKRNLLLYHLYTKHGVPPPRNCQFPKCDQCDYVALSESLLIKHRNNHSNNKEFVCKVCNAAFKSNGALQGHMQTNLHSDPAKKLYECPFCQKPFVRNINLKAHIRTCHKEVIRKMDEEENLNLENKHTEFANLQHFEDGEEAHSSDAVGDDSLNVEEDEEGELVEVPVIDSVIQKPGTGTSTVLLPSGVTVLAEAPAVQTLVPSSEAEALSNVASGIAASLGLADTLTGEQTVIVLDENQEFILHSTEIVGEETTSTDGKDDVIETGIGTRELQEYIVPEILPDEGQEQDQSYSGPLSDLEHYSGETNAVPPTQTTAPPPVSVAVSVVGGDEVTMVLTDHDYAPIRDSNGEGVMFLLTRPEDHDVKCSVAVPHPESVHEPELPVLQKELPQAPPLPPPPEETCAMATEIRYSNLPPILTREDIDSHDNMDDSVVISENTNVIITDEIMPDEENIENITQSTSSESLQVDQVEILEKGVEMEMETNNDNQEMKVIIGGCIEEVRPQDISSTEEIIHEQSSQEENVEDEEARQVSNVRTYSPTKKTVPSTVPIRRQPPVQMADIMKEWDDFDDEEEGDNSSELHPSGLEHKHKIVSDIEPRILRGPLGGE